MTEKMPLVSLTEIAQRAGVQKSAVSMWRTRHEDFPDTVADLHCGPIFWWPSVEKWLKATNRPHNRNLSVEDVNRYTRNRRKQSGVGARILGESNGE